MVIPSNPHTRPAAIVEAIVISAPVLLLNQVMINPIAIPKRKKKKMNSRYSSLKVISPLISSSNMFPPAKRRRGIMVTVPMIWPDQKRIFARRL